jgi:hypothetical protein
MVDAPFRQHLHIVVAEAAKEPQQPFLAQRQGWTWQMDDTTEKKKGLLDSEAEEGTPQEAVVILYSK